MMKRNLVIAVTLVMNMVAFGQSFSKADAEELAGLNFDWSVETVKAAPATKTTTARTTRSVSVRQLASASSRRSNTTARPARRAASAQQTAYAAAPQNVQQNDLQSQLNAAASANASQRVITGVVEHNYINDIEGNTTLIVRTSGFGGSLKKFTMRGYRNVVIPVYQGDYVAFVVTYGMNGMNEYPIVNYNELVNVTGTNRYLQEYADHYYGGDTAMMLANTPGASKWQRTISSIATGAMTVASVAMLAKEVVSWFK